ncbi:aspartic proteinase 3 [[Candida] railenensis]|uniref:candidapepsin n=1 Tax=[Candida] railenensis TaxID=45579 RepID=A0A9P0QPT2_9ASCO|nr:aspartic proteinase 3 [[Candida] railenensis]
MTHFLAATLLFAASYVASTSGLGTTLPGGGILLDFEVKRGDTYDTLSSDNKPYLYRRDGDVTLTLGNELNMYVATLEVGSNNQKNTIQVDTGSSDLWFMAKDVECFVPDYQKRRRRDYSSHQNNRVLAERDIFDDLSTMFGYETIVYGGDSGDETAIGVATATGTSPGDIAPTNTCINYGSFETSSSSSFKRNESAPEFYIMYGDGTGASGYWGYDSIKIGSTTLDSVSFGIANESTTNCGILGLGLEGLESTNSYEYSNFPVLLKQEGAINKVAYSLYLNAVNATTGSVLFGAVDHAKYSGTLATVPILNKVSEDPSAFHVMLDGISFSEGSNDFSVTSNKYTALLDSGTSLTVLPESLFSKFGDALGGEYSEEVGYYVVNCPKSSDDFTVNFDFSGLTISVPYSNFILAASSDSSGGAEQCYLGIQSQQEDFVILGDNVMSSGYFVYDLEDLTISLAQAKYTDESDIEVISSSIPSATQASLYSSTDYETGIVESSAESIFSYATGIYTPAEITAETGIFEATETGSGDQTGSNTGSGSKTSGSKSGSSTSTSSTTKSSGEVQTVKFTLISNLVASAFGLLVLVVF